jgi:hypothetical protein
MHVAYLSPVMGISTLNRLMIFTAGKMLWRKSARDTKMLWGWTGCVS